MAICYSAFPLSADGTFDEKEETVINGFGDWMAVNSEAIYSTRPWKIFDEGPIADSDIKINYQGFNEGAYTNATSSEIRFTHTPRYLYAISLAWPEDGEVKVKALAKGSKLFDKKIKRVELLGFGKVPFEQTAECLEVTLPNDAPQSYRAANKK